MAQVLHIQEVVRCIMQEKERLQAAHKQQLTQLTQALQQVSGAPGVGWLGQHVTLVLALVRVRVLALILALVRC